MSPFKKSFSKKGSKQPVQSSFKMSFFKPKGEDKKKKKGSGNDKAFAQKLERELPFVVTLVTIMAASGISPFGSFTKLARYKLLPNIMKEARKMVNMVHILGDDPLTAMEKRAEDTKSSQYRDLLLGYVSTVRNGGDIANFLQSKMTSIFDFEVAIARQSVAKIGGLVDAYMIMQVIALSLYVVVGALSSLPTGDLIPASLSDPTLSYFLVFVMLPGISMVMLYALDKTLSSSLIGTEKILKTGTIYSLAAIGAFAALYFTGIIQQIINPIYAFSILLGAASFLPGYKSLKAEKNMKAMESELHSYLREIAEARKAGLSPEKCIIYASERLRDAEFTSVVRSFSNQLEWGVPLRKIYENLVDKVKSKNALIHFRILIEAIESGGGYTTSLEILARSSEAAHNTEKEKKAMLSPYVMIGFMVTALTSLTTLMVSQTFVDVSQAILPGADATQAQVTQSDQKSSTQLLAIGISAQAWMTGFLVGKLSTGSFSTGFRYGLILLIVSTLAAVMTLELNISPSVFMKSPSPAGGGLPIG